ncbi:hypothetical protein GXW74_17125 [Roseomonas eburnea]|uniref:Uncharacterized protein n=1 Tax=Neoroseomonas eburnea TaxID=1346889 RepID=A0A9X9XET0_9PROT|nr:hypothetical protein [Neoroseomonas eburnea]MBR0682216.1 hypothetical protein [Neoroseomonas eburnea]
MRAVGFGVAVVLAGCGVADHYPPSSPMDAPAIEFRNAAGEGRWCTSPSVPRAFAEAQYRSCRDSLLAGGYREIGPWCGARAPTEGETATSVALSALGGGILGAVNAGRLADVQRIHYEECQRRAAAQ